MKLLEGRNLAEWIRDKVLREFCDRVEIAGSIRRARSVVGDIDFVVLPKAGQRAQLESRIKARNEVVKSGEQYLVARTKAGVQVDIWFAHNGTADLLAPEPSNFGSLLLCRTGSKEHNILLCRKAQELGMKWETTRGLVHNGRVIASATEEEIFQALGMEFVIPVQRECAVPAASLPEDVLEAGERAFSTTLD